jgi:hypothetical protein
MKANRDVRTVDVDCLRQEALTRAWHDGLAPKAAADAALGEWDVHEDVLRELAHTGLRYLVDRDLSAERASPPPDHVATDSAPRSGRWQHRPAPDETTARWYWLRKMFVGADGEMRPLVDFDADSLAFVQQRARRQRDAFERRVNLFDTALVHLEESDVDVVRDLPEDDLVQLESMAASALGGF